MFVAMGYEPAIFGNVRYTSCENREKQCFSKQPLRVRFSSLIRVLAFLPPFPIHMLR